MAINNPYIPGDPYSYDLKWIIRHIKEIDTTLSTLDQKIIDMIVQLLDQHDPLYWKNAEALIHSDMKTPSLAYIEGFYEPGDGGANLYYLTSDYNDVLAASFYLTLDGSNRWAIPIITTNYVTPEMFGVHGDGIEDDTAAINTALGIADRPIMFTRRYRVNVDQLGGTAIVVPEGKHLVIDGEIFMDGNAFATYNLINTDGNDDIIIEGSGTLTGDRYSHTGTTGEWGHVLTIANSDNVKVRDITMTGGWGDGLYITKSHDIDVMGVTCTDNRRNGCSIISGKNIALRSSKFTNQNGTAPQGGVDVEPNSDDTELENISVVDCDCTGNVGGSFGLGNSYVDNATVLFSNIMANSVGIRNTGANSNVIVSDVSIKCNNTYYPVTAMNTQRSSAVTFQNVIVDMNGYTSTGAIYYPEDKIFNVAFDNCVFKNGTVDRAGFWPAVPANREVYNNRFTNCTYSLTTTTGFPPVPTIDPVIPYGMSCFDGTIMNTDEMILASSNSVKATTSILKVTGTSAGYSISINLSERGTAGLWVFNTSGVSIIMRGSSVGGVIGGDPTIPDGQSAYFTPLSPLGHYAVTIYS